MVLRYRCILDLSYFFATICSDLSLKYSAGLHFCTVQNEAKPKKLRVQLPNLEPTVHQDEVGVQSIDFGRFEVSQKPLIPSVFCPGAQGVHCSANKSK